MRPSSFPYLNIAKRFGLDYGDVLNVAQDFRNRDRPLSRYLMKVQRQLNHVDYAAFVSAIHEAKRADE